MRLQLNAHPCGNIALLAGSSNVKVLVHVDASSK
jgi:hypothetical protein